MSNLTYLSTATLRRAYQPLKNGSILFSRFQSTSPAIATTEAQAHLNSQLLQDLTNTPSPITRLTTWSLIRNVILSAFLTRPLLLKPGLAFMRMVANSQSPLLNPDKNPLLRATIKPVVYDQFCAGVNDAEIRQTIANIRALGFSGVALCYGKELQLDTDNKMLGSSGRQKGDIELWREGTLKTVDLAGDNNWIGIKYTGAGPEVTEALCRGEAPPPEFLEAMKAVCERTAQHGSRIWIDAEQQAVQPTIDKWTLDLMREYNRDDKVLLYGTVQAYLKASREKLRNQLRLAEQEGWTLGVKLVRGAYIANDKRSLIHDTKADTDASYNGIVRDVLQGEFEGLTTKSFSHLRILLAGHNSESVRKALSLAQNVSDKGKLLVRPEFAQLQGMADDLGCEIIAFRERGRSSNISEKEEHAIFRPHAYKCLTWGSLQECMQYLVRRAVENAGAVDRMREGAAESMKELKRRFFKPFLGRSRAEA